MDPRAGSDGDRHMALEDGESPLPEVPADAILLVSGPPMTGKYELMLRLLAERCDGVVVISTKNHAARVIQDYRGIDGPVDDDRIGVVDCVSHQENLEPLAAPTVKRAGSPENLTKIGVHFTELADAFAERTDLERVGVGLHSLSQLVVHTGMKQVYQFMQVLTGQIRDRGWLGVAVIDASVHDEERLQTMQHHFDGVVETRENDAGQRELRVRGLSPSASPWTSF